MPRTAPVIRLHPKREKTAATHGFCDPCGEIREIEAVPIRLDGHLEVLYECASVQCRRCRAVIAELYRRREFGE